MQELRARMADGLLSIDVPKRRADCEKVVKVEVQ